MVYQSPHMGIPAYIDGNHSIAHDKVMIIDREVVITGSFNFTRAADFIRQCDSPLTIALQGDWGSGKTSLMNLIKEKLEQENINLKIIWFNTWQYSQFDMQDDLAISLITHFIEEIGGVEKQDAKMLISQISSLAKVGIAAGLKFAAGKVGTEFADKTLLSKSDTKHPAQLLKELKDRLEELVVKSGRKVVVFIDDLDRLVPLKAVEFLEVFKLFLDIPGCVYILACDYNVVIQGLKVKFGIGEGYLKGKNFFDKIIQLPFNMPVSAYEAHKYVDDLLTKIGIDHGKQDTAQYVNIISFSIGFNPRNIKRLFNTLLLIKMVAEKKNILDDTSDGASKAEKEKVLFGLLCLEMAYEPVYKYLHRIEIDQNIFESFRDPEKQQNINDYAIIKEGIGDTDGSKLIRLADFMKAFYDAIKLRSDDTAAKLSESELDNLEKMLKLSQITSRVSSDVGDAFNSNEKRKNIRYAKKVINEINSQFNLNKKADMFNLGTERKLETVDIYKVYKYGNKTFELDFSFAKEGMEIWVIGANKYTKDQDVKDLLDKLFLDKHVKDYFQEYKYINDDGDQYYELYNYDFPNGFSRMDKELQIKNKILETLSLINPILLKD